MATGLRADTIYTNFGTNDAYSSGAGVLVTNDGEVWSSVAIAFTPSANYNLTSIEFVATDLFPTDLILDDPNNITLGIFADSDGQPGGAPLESFTAGSLESFGSAAPVLTVTSVLQPLLLANTQYWIGMNAGPGEFIIWNQNITSADGFLETDGFGNWSASDSPQDQGVLEVDGVLAQSGQPQIIQSDQSDDQIGSTPEPATWWLMATALGLMAVRTGAQSSARFPNQK